jgi:hypothetical protein
LKTTVIEAPARSVVRAEDFSGRTEEDNVNPEREKLVCRPIFARNAFLSATQHNSTGLLGDESRIC